MVHPYPNGNGGRPVSAVPVSPGSSAPVSPGSVTPVSPGSVAPVSPGGHRRAESVFDIAPVDPAPPPFEHRRSRFEAPGPIQPLYEPYEPPLHEPYEPPPSEPPTFEKSRFEPPTYEPPTYEPPTYEPPTYEPSAFEPSASEPPTFAEIVRHRTDQLEIDTEPMLPQRVPAEPDVPDVPLAPDDPLRMATPDALTDRVELSRIANYLKDSDRPAERQDWFDVDAIVAHVLTVPDVRDAKLRRDAAGGHILRIELLDGADAGLVSREVARLLKDKLGLAAEPNPPSRLKADETTMERSRAGRLHRPYVTTPAPVGRARPDVRSIPDVRSSPGAGVERQAGRPLPRPNRGGAGAEPVRVVLDHVQLTTLGVDAEVEVRLAVSTGARAIGRSHGPGVDAYLLRLAATAATDAIGQLLLDEGTGQPRARCFVEHVAVVPFGGCEVAVVVLLLVCGGWAEQLSGSAIVDGEPRQAVVRATLSAVNRRLESLLA
jgi:hypothetical protein